MRSAGLADKPVTTYVKAEKPVLEELGADAHVRVHFGHHGSTGILQQPLATHTPRDDYCDIMSLAVSFYPSSYPLP
jgi:hypothetical protein